MIFKQCLAVLGPHGSGRGNWSRHTADWKDLGLFAGQHGGDLEPGTLRPRTKLQVIRRGAPQNAG